MRLTPSLLVVPAALAILAACGTKTPLTLPPPSAQKSTLPTAPASGAAQQAEAAAERRP